MGPLFADRIFQDFMSAHRQVQFAWLVFFAAILVGAVIVASVRTFYFFTHPFPCEECGAVRTRRNTHACARCRKLICPRCQSCRC